MAQNNKKMIVVEEDNGEDAAEPFFNRLPDDLVILIFDKICDSKFLCRCCSLVSKHFSSLVYQIHIVSFRIPDHVQRSQRPSTAFDLELNPQQFVTKILGKFTSMRSLYLVFDYSRSGALLKWKYDGRSSNVVLVSASSLGLCNDDDDNYVLRCERIIELCTTLWGYYYDVVDSFRVTKKLVPYLTESLQNWVDFGASKLVDEMRNSNTDLIGAGLKLRYWCEPVTKLQISDSVSWMVILFIAKGEGSDLDDHLLVKEAFEGEENIYVEAATKMLKKDHIFEEIM